MAKFNVSTGSRGQLDSLEDLATPELPTGDPQAQPDTQAAPQDDGLIAQLVAQPVTEAETQERDDGQLQEQVDQGIQQGLDDQDRFSVPTLNERAQDAQAFLGGQSTQVPKWIPDQKNESIPGGQEANGDILKRAGKLGENVHSGALVPSVSLPWKTFDAELTQQEKVDSYREQKGIEDSLVTAAHSVGAVESIFDETTQRNKQVPSRQYLAIGSAVVENMVADASFGDSDIDADQFADDVQVQFQQKKGKTNPLISKAKNNAAVGRQIQQEWLRSTGADPATPVSQQEAEVLGDAFKSMWAATNPDLVKAFRGPDNQIYYQPTADGMNAFSQGSEFRKRLFPKTNVRPSKQPVQSGQLPGDVGGTQVKKSSGKVGSVDFSQTIKEATKNLATVPNVVDKQRAKILLATVLPTLAGADPLGPDGWKAEINNVGESKIQKFEAAVRSQQIRRAAAERDNKPFLEKPLDPAKILLDVQTKLAQEVRSIVQERNGANYLTYGIQAYNGRIAPQQSYFDPTTSKAVRFVTRNAVPSVAKPGSRIENNLRQMYAMMLLPSLVKDADSFLPKKRDQQLLAQEGKLEQWGDRLSNALTMTDAQYEAVSGAIEQGLAVNSPQFPQFDGLNLDPEADRELISAIKKKGEDGPHFIDGLIDFAKYAKAKKRGVPHSSYFNAYIDGKTNGLASNGIQMGHIGTAERTGVIRNNKENLLDDGDIRDELKKISIQSIDNGWDGDTLGLDQELRDVATKVFGYRQMNKDTTMTFGYGKEIDSFKTNISEALDFLSASAAPTATQSNPLQWDKGKKNDFMAWWKGKLKAESSYEGHQAEVLFHSSPANTLSADSFKYRAVGVDNKGASGKGAGIFTHGYDTDGSKFGQNVYAVVYDKKSPTYAGKEDTSATALNEIFIPQKAVGEMIKVWPPSPEIVEKFNGERGTTDGTPEGDSFNDSLAVLDEKFGREDLVDTLLNKYKTALEEVLSQDAIDSRKLMRSSAIMHAAWNELMSIKSYTGMDLNFGKNQSTGYEAAEVLPYSITKDGKRHSAKAVSYQSEPTSAAARKRTDSEGNVTETPGDYAYGGSIPGPVQSLDAATVALSVSGDSWKKLKAKSGGNPYVHTIYDAFKMDAAGYDTVLEEVNKNWLKATMEWNYLEETLKATQEARRRFDKKVSIDPRGLVKDNERLYFDYMTQHSRDNWGKPQMKNFRNKVSKSMDSESSDQAFQLGNQEMVDLAREMKKIGYDVTAPPQPLTYRQLKVFTDKLEAALQVDKRLKQQINRTKKNKEILRKEILKRGHTTPSGEKIALQYYAH